MLLLALALTGQLSAALPANLDHWFFNDDVPRYLIEGPTGTWQVGIRVEVEPNGVIRDCNVETTSGIPNLDRLTCRLILQRGKFHAARWTDGSPTFGIYRSSVKWVVASTPFEASKEILADLDYSVQKLPAGTNSPSLVKVMFAVDSQGRTSSCSAEPTWPQQKIDNDPALVPVACERLLKDYRATPAKDQTGTAVPSVQDALIRFWVRSH